MTLAIDFDSYDYKFNKTLNEDVKLKSDEYGLFDLDMHNGDYVNVTGIRSLLNACIIAILTRYNEIQTPTYQDFGCHAHELIKDNQTEMLLFKLETYIIETLSKMRRVYTINSIQLTPTNGKILVEFNITSITDEIVAGSVIL